MPAVHVKSYGCSANTADEEIVKGILTNSNYKILSKPDSADANLILTCIVKTPTELKIIKELKRLYETGKPLIVAGCMPQAMQSQVEKIFPNASLVGPNNIENIVEVVKETIQGHKVIYLNGDPTDRTCLPRVRRNNLIHISPISSGCLGNCSYCIVRYARGQLSSFSAAKIVEDARKAIQAGCKEIWVTAEDTAAYKDNDTKLPDLLRMLYEVPGDFRIRVGMMTPNQIIPIVDDFIDSLKNYKVFKFVHIPLQSGNNEILKRMNRHYTVEDYTKLVRVLREAYPWMGISTDLICGFPGESKQQFQDSIDIVMKLKPDVLNISRFWERPGTVASKLNGKLHGRETKERSRKLTSIWKTLAIDVGKKWMGWEGDVLLDEFGKRGNMMGRNYAYKTIVVKTKAVLGEWVPVKVTGIGIGFLKAHII
jgi:MiaB-like tRNA modifying enzyme